MRHRSVQAVAALALVTSCSGDPYLPAGRFAGCYLARGAQRLRLSPNGIISADGKAVGNYKVLAPVGGKHGPLVEATGVDVTARNGHVTFVPGSGGFFWAVSDAGLNVVFAPNGQMEFARAPDAACT